MAGRGCTITIKILGGSSGNGENEDMSLPVALHSPLQVLKEQLADLVGIAIPNQVLILCDLNDVDRNSDRLLAGVENLTLRQCGISSGSVLTLHALGMSAERKQQMAKDALSNKKKVDPNEQPTYHLETEVTAANANHSYNGVVFDVSSDGPYEIEIVSVYLAGMLGRIRIFTRECGWEQNKPLSRPSPHWWAHRESLSKVGWTRAADVQCRPSWDKPVEIKLARPLRLLPHERKAIYCHSGLPDDLGIQYQSYPEHSEFASDEYITLYSGLGHTGSEPFEDVHGWYRGGRGLAGSVRYRRKHKGWSIFEHQIFPTPLQQAVMTMLMCQNRVVLPSAATENGVVGSSSGSVISSSSSPPVGAPMECVDDDAGLKDDRPYQEEVNTASCKSSITAVLPRKRSSSGSSLSSLGTSAISAVRSLLSPRSPKSPPPSEVFRNERIVTRSSTVHNNMQRSNGMYLHRLHVHIVYHILEFMDWDWFADIEDNESEMEEEEEEADGLTSKKEPSMLTRATTAASRAAQMLRQSYVNNYLLELLGQAEGSNPEMSMQLHNFLSHIGQIDFDDQEDDEDDDDDFGMEEEEYGDEFEEEEEEQQEEEEGEDEEIPMLEEADLAEAEEEEEDDVEEGERGVGGKKCGSEAVSLWRIEHKEGESSSSHADDDGRGFTVHRARLDQLQPKTILDMDMEEEEEDDDDDEDYEDL